MSELKSERAHINVHIIVVFVEKAPHSLTEFSGGGIGGIYVVIRHCLNWHKHLTFGFDSLADITKGDLVQRMLSSCFLVSSYYHVV